MFLCTSVNHWSPSGRTGCSGSTEDAGQNTGRFCHLFSYWLTRGWLKLCSWVCFLRHLSCLFCTGPAVCCPLAQTAAPFLSFLSCLWSVARTHTHTQVFPPLCLFSAQISQQGPWMQMSRSEIPEFPREPLVSAAVTHCGATTRVCVCQTCARTHTYTHALMHAYAFLFCRIMPQKN